MTTGVTATRPPTAFISYSWDDEAHKAWVKDFATRLRGDGIDAKLDRWEAVPGDQLPAFMEQAIRENDFVLILCTPKYKVRSELRKGGVGYEGDIMTGELLTTGNQRKFIPILRDGDPGTALPNWLQGKYRIDLRGNPYSDEQYKDLTTTLLNGREQPPPVGVRPPSATPTVSLREASKQFLAYDEPATSSFEPIGIVGVIADEVGEPRNDGTHGSALYAVPLKLSRAPSREWSDLFIRTWDYPPEFTTMHRPGIARVQGDRIILTRTTIEELKDVHRKTLKLVVDEVNRQIETVVAARQQAEQSRIREVESHRERVRNLADEIDFA